MAETDVSQTQPQASGTKVPKRKRRRKIKKSSQQETLEGLGVSQTQPQSSGTKFSKRSRRRKIRKPFRQETVEGLDVSSTHPQSSGIKVPKRFRRRRENEKSTCQIESVSGKKRKFQIFRKERSKRGKRGKRATGEAKQRKLELKRRKKNEERDKLHARFCPPALQYSNTPEYMPDDQFLENQNNDSPPHSSHYYGIGLSGVVYTSETSVDGQDVPLDSPNKDAENTTHEDLDNLTYS